MNIPDTCLERFFKTRVAWDEVRADLGRAESYFAELVGAKAGPCTMADAKATLRRLGKQEIHLHKKMRRQLFNAYEKAVLGGLDSLSE